MSTIMERDTQAATLSLKQWREGAYVEDDWYRHALKDHGKGVHRGMKSGLCPACLSE